MLQLRTRKAPVALRIVIDTVNYELAPYCEARGGDLWIEALEPDRVVLGFRCPPGRRAALRGWLESAITRLAPGQPDFVRVLDLTTCAGSRREV